MTDGTRFAAGIRTRPSIGQQEAPQTLLKKGLAGLRSSLAERQGFEPWVPIKSTPVFETGPFDRSGTSPRMPTAGPTACEHVARPAASDSSEPLLYQPGPLSSRIAKEKVALAVGGDWGIPTGPGLAGGSRVISRRGCGGAGRTPEAWRGTRGGGRPRRPRHGG